jgi:PIN domain nuclease of toxin-antitoxin system
LILLLDTHALLWWMAGDPRLGTNASALVADPANDVLVSVVSLWEIVVKQRAGKLRADTTRLAQIIDQIGFTLIGIKPAHLKALSDLPFHHRDPFDHLLMAQAIHEAAVFLSQDRYVAHYPVRALACSAQA